MHIVSKIKSVETKHESN